MALLSPKWQEREFVPEVFPTPNPFACLSLSLSPAPSVLVLRENSEICQAMLRAEASKHREGFTLRPRHRRATWGSQNRPAETQASPTDPDLACLGWPSFPSVVLKHPGELYRAFP